MRNHQQMGSQPKPWQHTGENLRHRSGVTVPVSLPTSASRQQYPECKLGVWPRFVYKQRIKHAIRTHIPATSNKLALNRTHNTPTVHLDIIGVS